MRRTGNNVNTGTMPATISIHGARFAGNHGVTVAEQRVGGQYEVDLSVVTNIARAAQSDRLSTTVDYERLYGIIARVITGERHRLLERVAGRIADEVLEMHKSVSRVSVAVRKLHPPIRGPVKAVEVQLVRER
jgi:dihydroneopterin aldolase